MWLTGFPRVWGGAPRLHPILFSAPAAGASVLPTAVAPKYLIGVDARILNPARLVSAYHTSRSFKSI